MCEFVCLCAPFIFSFATFTGVAVVYFRMFYVSALV